MYVNNVVNDNIWWGKKTIYFDICYLISYTWKVGFSVFHLDIIDFILNPIFPGDSQGTLKVMELGSQSPIDKSNSLLLNT